MQDSSGCQHKNAGSFASAYQCLCVTVNVCVVLCAIVNLYLPCASSGVCVPNHLLGRPLSSGSESMPSSSAHGTSTPDAESTAYTCRVQSLPERKRKEPRPGRLQDGEDLISTREEGGEGGATKGYTKQNKEQTERGKQGWERADEETQQPTRLSDARQNGMKGSSRR